MTLSTVGGSSDFFAQLKSGLLRTEVSQSCPICEVDSKRIGELIQDTGDLKILNIFLNSLLQFNPWIGMSDMTRTGICSMTILQALEDRFGLPFSCK